MTASTNTNSPDHIAEAHIRERILHTLTIYPRISHSMLHVGLGNAIPSKVWRPVLEQLEAEDAVIIDLVPTEYPSGRVVICGVIRLPKEPTA